GRTVVVRSDPIYRVGLAPDRMNAVTTNETVARTLGPADVEEAVELRRPDDLLHLRIEVAQAEPPPDGLQLLVQRDQGAQRGARYEAHAGQVQAQVLRVRPLRGLEDLLLDHQAVVLVQDRVGEADDRHAVRGLGLERPAPGSGCHRGVSEGGAYRDLGPGPDGPNVAGSARPATPRSGRA